MEAGTSVLMAAAQGGHLAVVNALLLAGAPWNAIDRKRRCAGDIAMDHDNMETAQALLEAGLFLLCFMAYTVHTSVCT